MGFFIAGTATVDHMTSPRQRFRENATGITSTVVTGVWLVALFTDQSWWLAALLFGYIVVVPVVSMLFGDDEDWEEHAETDEQWADGERGADWTGGGWTTEEPGDGSPATDSRDALETLRDRYARGELTDEQFERKVERLLDTESLEATEERYRERERLRE